MNLTNLLRLLGSAGLLERLLLPLALRPLRLLKNRNTSKLGQFVFHINTGQMTTQVLAFQIQTVEIIRENISVSQAKAVAPKVCCCAILSLA